MKQVSLNNWNDVTLCDAVYPVSKTFNFKSKDKVHFLNTGDILEGKLLHKDLVDVAGLPGQAKKAFELNDILFSEIRPQNKRYMLVNFDSSNSVASTKLMVLRAKENINVQYIYKLLTFKSTLQEFQMIAESRSGTFPQITFDAVSNFKFKMPPIEVQDKIVSLLSSLDNKIDVLQRENATLEELAGTYFLNLFGNSSEDSVPTLDNWIDFDPKEKIDRKQEYRFFDMKTLSEDSMNIAQGLNRKVSSATSFRNYDTLLAKITPCLENGKTGFVMNLNDGEIARGSTEFVVMRSKGIVSPFWIYCLARSKNFRDKAIQSMTGTSGRQRVQISQLKNIKIAFSKHDMETFHNTCTAFFNKIKSNSLQMSTLTNLRDTLLPKLFNGEISIN